jgi:hypothetical protein
VPCAKPGELKPYLTLDGPNSIRQLPPPRFLIVAGKREFLQDGTHTYGKGDSIEGRKDIEKKEN